MGKATDEFGLTQVHVFLQTLEVTGNVSTACKESEINRRRAYALKEQDPDFSDAWEDALDVAADELLAYARTQALSGHSDKMLEMLIKHTVKGFRDTSHIEVTHTLKKPVAELTDEELLAIVEQKHLENKL